MIVDIHNHILPRLDDGPDGMADALLMAEQAVEAGITHVVATPHHRNETFTNRPPQILQKTEELNLELTQNNIPLTILPGMELHLHGDVAADLEKLDQAVLPLCKGPYILIELPYAHIPHFTDSIFYQLQLRGYIPIIAHPERNAEIKRQPNRLFNLINQGALVQITAASVVGLFGSDSQKFSQKLIRHHLVHFIASDAHNTTNRSFQLTCAYAWVEEHVSTEYKDYLAKNAIHVAEGTEFSIIPPIKLKKRKVWRGMGSHK
jgi:protein-tyrosine phosphatase